MERYVVSTCGKIERGCVTRMQIESKVRGAIVKEPVENSMHGFIIFKPDTKIGDKFVIWSFRGLGGTYHCDPEGWKP